VLKLWRKQKLSMPRIRNFSTKKFNQKIWFRRGGRLFSTLLIFLGSGFWVLNTMQLNPTQMINDSALFNRGVLGVNEDSASSSNDAKYDPKDLNCPVKTPVKGQILINGQKIYHVEQSPFYSKIRPDACFKDISEAVNQGYKAFES
jgi:hypothetical protein